MAFSTKNDNVTYDNIPFPFGVLCAMSICENSASSTPVKKRVI